MLMRRYFVFATAGLGLLMSSIDGSVVAVAFPNIIKDLGTNLLWAAWTISIYFIALTMALPIGGNLSDSLGRKKVFIISLVVFTGSSLVCGLAPNIYVLIAFRFLQGIGGASFLPTASGIVSDHFPENRATAIGLFSSIFSVGSIIGPNLGGWIVSRYSWRYVFYVNLPIGMLLIVLILVLLKSSEVSHTRHTDYAGASFMAGAVLFLMFGLNCVGESLSFPSLLLAALVMLLGLLFQHITLPAAAGQVPQTVDIGPMVVIFLAIFLSITALIVWLARFAVFRAILLILIVVNVVSVLTQIGVAIPADRIALLVDVGWDIGYAALLILSLTSQRPQLR